MKKVVRINIQGVYVEDVILQDGEEVPKDCIETPCPDGFYKPKWDSEKWVEGGTESILTPEQQIIYLKAKLTATDYKIIKCSECNLAGVELPYNIAVLHAERQALRDQINMLETT